MEYSKIKLKEKTSRLFFFFPTRKFIRRSVLSFYKRRTQESSRIHLSSAAYLCNWYSPAHAIIDEQLISRKRYTSHEDRCWRDVSSHIAPLFLHAHVCKYRIIVHTHIRDWFGNRCLQRHIRVNDRDSFFFLLFIFRIASHVAFIEWVTIHICCT